MNNKKSRYSVARKILIFWCLFIGLGAIWGGTAMLIAPNGSLLQMQDMLPYFKKLPFADILFKDYVFSGIALICVNGITNIISSIFLFKKKNVGIILGMLFGVTLMLWICIQFYMFPMNFLSASYFVFGMLQAMTGYAAFVFYKQEQFSVDVTKYKSIGQNKDELVIYFSRMGYTKKVAYEEANRLGADIFEITTPEPVLGTGGFWWCGFFALRGMSMEINPIDTDLSRYEHVTICSPIWVFNICSPMKAFCEKEQCNIRSVSYILLHHTNGRYENIVKKLDEILDLKHKSAVSIRCRTGNMKKL